MKELSLLRGARQMALEALQPEKKIPAFVSDPPRLPSEPTVSAISELSGWWLEFRPACKCGRLGHFSFDRICKIARPYDPTLKEILERVKYSSCGAGPASAYLIDLASPDDAEEGERGKRFRLRLM